LKEISNFAGMDGFHWFIGRVEARVVSAGTDPLRLGRVKVRVIGTHTQDKNQLPTEHLPWATVMHPVTSPGISGVGTTPNLIEGTTVFGFFLDALDKQHPVIIGTIPGRDVPGASSDHRVSSRTGATGQTLAAAEPYVGTGEVADEPDVVTCAENGAFGPSAQFSSGINGRLVYSNYNEGAANSNIRGLLKQYGGPGVAKYVANKPDRKILWCAAFASAALNRCGFLSPNTTGSQVFGVNASKYGELIATGSDFSIDKLKKGDVIVYKWPAGRGSTGHVGFYTGKNASGRIGVLGGNQSNTLCSKLMSTKNIAYVVRPRKA
jgi:hypothetical protein